MSGLSVKRLYPCVLGKVGHTGISACLGPGKVIGSHFFQGDTNIFTSIQITNTTTNTHTNTLLKKIQIQTHKYKLHSNTNPITNFMCSSIMRKIYSAIHPNTQPNRDESVECFVRGFPPSISVLFRISLPSTHSNCQIPHFGFPRRIHIDMGREGPLLHSRKKPGFGGGGLILGFPPAVSGLGTMNPRNLCLPSRRLLESGAAGGGEGARADGRKAGPSRFSGFGFPRGSHVDMGSGGRPSLLRSTFVTTHDTSASH